MQPFKTLKNLKNNLDPRLVLFLLVALIIFTTGSSVLQSTPIKDTPTPAPIQAEISALPTPSPFPEDFLNNEKQTVGPTIAASALVLVVVIGVLSRLLQKNAG